MYAGRVHATCGECYRGRRTCSGACGVQNRDSAQSSRASSCSAVVRGCRRESERSTAKAGAAGQNPANLDVAQEAEDVLAIAGVNPEDEAKDVRRSG